jgi:DNA polymerase III epsilon subunit-like protein
VNSEGIKAELKKLIEKRRTIDETTSEANIEATLISQLFTLLGWNFLDPSVYDRNSYVRGAGYADIALKIDNEPVIFVEVKKIGKIPKNRIDPQAQMTLPLKELADLIDRTPEEKQAFKYARSKEIPWALLTNFDCLYVFNADQERIILSFRTPEEYLQKFEDLLLLSREKIKGKSLEWLQDQIRKEEIDKNFLEKLKNWRVSLAQNIYDENRDNHVLRNEKGDFDWDTLMHIVQRILSRLLIIQIADDREVLRTHNILETLLKSHEDKGDYSKEDYLLKEFIDLSHMMDEHHNTTIFAPGHPCEKVFIPNSVFARILRELCHISFRKMTADILGATYESYLGYRFSLKNGRIESEVDQRVRKQAGIYYTPSYIVRYIVDNTLGVKLKELEDQYGLEAGEKTKDLKILDPACGSGSFLIYAFDVLANFYERINDKIRNEQIRLTTEHSNPDIFEMRERLKNLPPTVSNYPSPPLILLSPAFGGMERGKQRER